MGARRRSDERGTPLSRALFAARETAGLLQVPVAQRLGMSQAWLSRVESGVAIPTAGQVADLLDLYGVHGEARRDVEQLIEDQAGTRKDRRLVVQRGRTAAMQARWSRITRDSHLVRAYHPAIVIGPLQSPAYAAVVLDEDAAALEERASQREALTQPRQRHVLVQTEGALRCTVGSVEVMREQIAHLVEVSSLPHIRLGVIPAARPMPFTCGTAFHLYEGEGFTAAVVGLEVAAATLTDPEDVAHFTALFERLAGMAVYDDEARALLGQIAVNFQQEE